MFSWVFLIKKDIIIVYRSHIFYLPASFGDAWFYKVFALEELPAKE